MKIFWNKILIASLSGIFLVQCGGSSGSTNDSAAGPESLGAAVGGLFSTTAGSSESLTASRAFARTLDESMEICNNLDGGPTRVVMLGRGSAGQFGSTTDFFAASQTDFCEDEDGEENSGSASDGGTLFATFTLIDEVVGDCSSGGVASTLSLLRGSGIVRNTDSYMPEIFGMFDINGAIANCTIRLQSDGTLDSATSSCTDASNNAVILSSSMSCNLEAGIDRITVPSSIEGHYAVSGRDEDLNAVYDCYALYPLGNDADGFTTVTSDCSLFEDYGFNLEGLNIGMVVGGDSSDWTIYSTTDLEQLASWIKILRSAGIAVMASVDILYVEAFTGSNYEVIADGTDFPSDLLADDDFEEALTGEILGMAEYLEKLDVEIFSPLSEADRVWNSAATASTYLQNTLSSIRERFTGDLMWIGQFFDSTDSSTYNLDGFDYAAVNVSPMPNQNPSSFETHVTTQLTNMRTLANAQGIPYLISNAGIWGGALSGNVYDWDAAASRVLEAFTIMKDTSDTLGTAGIIFWEGAEGEVVFQNYSNLSQYIATEFGGDPTAF